VRSGGHNPAPGFSNIDDGILIDLSGLDEVTYNSSNGTVVVGTGNRWLHVYQVLGAFNMTVVGGRTPEIGVGGLTLGGGLSYLSNKHGLVCDNVVNFEVLLASGEIVDANTQSHPDLFWALKGGSNNFGIVTRFTLSVFPQGNVWGGTRLYSLAQSEDILEAFLEWLANGISDLNSNLLVDMVVTNETAAVTFFYAEPVVWPDVFAPFFAIPFLQDDVFVRSYTSFLEDAPVNVIVMAEPRIRWSATSFSPDERILSNTLNRTIQESTVLKTIIAGASVIGFQPVHPNLVAQGHLKGGNALGLEARLQIWCSLTLGWFFSEDDKAIETIAGGIFTDIVQAAEQGELRYEFMNDASSNQDVIYHYGSENAEKLKVIAQKYDPERVFQTQQPGGFKI